MYHKLTEFIVARETKENTLECSFLFVAKRSIEKGRLAASQHKTNKQENTEQRNRL